MDINRKMELLTELFELEEGEFTAETNLDDLEEWDSLAAISYVVMMDEEFDKIANPRDIQGFKTVNDILNSME